MDVVKLEFLRDNQELSATDTKIALVKENSLVASGKDIYSGGVLLSNVLMLLFECYFYGSPIYGGRGFHVIGLRYYPFFCVSA